MLNRGVDLCVKYSGPSVLWPSEDERNGNPMLDPDVHNPLSESRLYTLNTKTAKLYSLVILKNNLSVEDASRKRLLHVNIILLTFDKYL